MFAIVQLFCLVNVGSCALLTAMLEKTVSSTNATEFDALYGESFNRCATQIFLHSHEEFFQNR